MSAANDSTRCTQCGARVPDLICNYCGTLVRPAESVGAQMQALREFHAMLQFASEERQKQLLTAGYFPSQESALVEAGLQCFPLLKDGEADQVSLAAANRLEAITARLRLQPEKPETQRAVLNFDARVTRFHRAEGRLTAIVIVLLIGIASLIVWGVVAYLRK